VDDLWTYAGDAQDRLHEESSTSCVVTGIQGSRGWRIKAWRSSTVVKEGDVAGPVRLERCGLSQCVSINAGEDEVSEMESAGVLG